MTAYLVAQIRIHDPERYQRYVARFRPTLEPFDGRLLAADTGPEVLEGEWGMQKFILLAFPDAATARQWASSAAYQAISTDRVAATDGVVLLVHGLPA